MILATQAAAPASAQAPGGPATISEEIVACAAIEDDANRLACYDRSVEPLLGDGMADDAAHVFAGENDWTSDVLRMARPWHLAWQSTAHLLSIELRTADEIFLALAGTQVGEGDGQSDMFDPGEYRISVSATGEWRIVLVEE